MSRKQKVYQRNKMGTFVCNSAKQLSFSLSFKSEKALERDTYFIRAISLVDILQIYTKIKIYKKRKKLKIRFYQVRYIQTVNGKPKEWNQMNRIQQKNIIYSFHLFFIKISMEYFALYI